MSRPGDRHEVEASRMADAALARSSSSRARSTPVVGPRRTPAEAPAGGRALPPAVRTALEPAFGRDFSDVRIHDAPHDRQLARQLSARAFTHEGQIWLGEGQHSDDLALMAHELAHVVQQTSGSSRYDNLIQRQPDDKGGAGGSVLPADPAAAKAIQYKGIVEYGAAEVPAIVGTGPTRAIRSGKYILGPQAIQCMNGEYATLFYVAYHLERKRSEWIVGPDSVDAFKAEAEERAQKAGGKTTATDASPVTIPLNRAHATEMKKSGIEPHYMARSVPYTSSTTTAKTIAAGEYDLVPHAVRLADGGEEILYYVARNRKNGYDQWIVGPDSLAEFQKNPDAYYAGAALAYMYGPPHGYEAESARFVWGGGSLGSAWGQASRDPKFLVQAAAAHVPVGRIVQPLARQARGITAAAMIGTSEAVPAVTLGAAPKAVIQAVEGSTARAVTQQAARPAMVSATQAAQPAVVAAAETAPTLAANTVTPAATGATAQLVSTGARAATTSVAPTLASQIDPDIDQRVEQAFVEHAPTTQPSQRPPLRRVQRTEEATQTRQDFGNVRDAYAQNLQVAAFGQVHHAVEVQVLSRYPGVYRPNEINAAANMRGIPPEVGRRTQLHNSKIREILDRHYRALDEEIARQGLQPGTPQYNALVRRWIDNAVAEIDYVLGQFFSEQRATLFLPQ